MGSPHLNKDCLIAVLAAAAATWGSSWRLDSLCRLATVSKEWRDACHEVLATQVLALQPSSFGPRANAVPVHTPAFCLLSGHLDLCPILRRCTALERLNLAGLHRITSDELLRTVAARCPRLRELLLDFCDGVTAAGLEVPVWGSAGRLPCRRGRGEHWRGSTAPGSATTRIF